MKRKQIPLYEVKKNQDFFLTETANVACQIKTNSYVLWKQGPHTSTIFSASDQSMVWVEAEEIITIERVEELDTNSTGLAKQHQSDNPELLMQVDVDNKYKFYRKVVRMV